MALRASSRALRAGGLAVRSVARVAARAAPPPPTAALWGAPARGRATAGGGATWMRLGLKGPSLPVRLVPPCRKQRQHAHAKQRRPLALRVSSHLRACAARAQPHQRRGKSDAPSPALEGGGGSAGGPPRAGGGGGGGGGGSAGGAGGGGAPVGLWAAYVALLNRRAPRAAAPQRSFRVQPLFALF
jgi:hypothetical protein